VTVKSGDATPLSRDRRRHSPMKVGKSTEEPLKR
jgi:hypothetical protein